MGHGVKYRLQSISMWQPEADGLAAVGLVTSRPANRSWHKIPVSRSLSRVGLVAFSDLQGAVDGIESVAADYEKHRIAANEIAREYFGYDRVLIKLLSDLGFG